MRESGKWVRAQIGAWFLGFCVLGLVTTVTLGIVMELGPLLGPLVAASACGVAVLLPGFLRPRCRTARLVQAAWVALVFAPFVAPGAGHPLLPIWLLLVQTPPATPSATVSAAAAFLGIGGVFFVACYIFLACVHFIAPERWHCVHAHRAV